MKIMCCINVEVKLNAQSPVDTITEIRLQRAEFWIKYKLHKRLKEIEDELNIRLHQEMFLREDEKIEFHNHQIRSPKNGT
jgi:hypothetical protein